LRIDLIAGDVEANFHGAHRQRETDVSLTDNDKTTESARHRSILACVTGVFVLLGIAIGVAVTHLWHFVARRHPLDTLTGVPTRSAAHDALRDLRVGDAVVMVDVDSLKATNDLHGHLAGDDVLRAVAAHLRSGVRAQDTVARWGGDEFVIVLRGGGGAAAEVVERLRASCPAEFSAGVAQFAGGRGEDALAAADAALLRAKRAGGSRVVAS
jgi:diguanylate cyclase (GGDEF)-like protein